MECPDSIEGLQELEKLIPLCKVTLFEQAKARIEKGTAKSVSEAARQIGEETGKPPESIRRRIQEEQGVRGAQLSALTGTDKFTPLVLNDTEKKAVLKEASSIKKEQREDSLRQRAERLAENKQPLPDNKYQVIYADPPWKYDNSGIGGAAEKHYPVMETSDICSMEIPSGENSVLFLWVTNPFLKEGLEVCSAWGFKYKTNIAWIKDKAGQGFYVKGQHELLFICTKGSFLPDNRLYIRSVVEAKREGHSKKPDIFYEIIETLYPNVKYLELFARNKREGWESWGLEA